MTERPPVPGIRVWQVLPDYRGTAVYHTLYLPVEWEAGRRYPVIVEYAGNGPYRSAYGDLCTGRVEDCTLGYGIGGGSKFIWACLPYISADGQQNQAQWWGDVAATVAYCKAAVTRICDDYGGDPGALFIAGFSRGAIACNYIGLHDEEIARLWRGFVAHSHYDGVRTWGYAGDDRRSSARRLARLRGRAQWVSHEGSVEETKRYLENVRAWGTFTFWALPYRNHTDAWVLRDIPARRALRRWIETLLDDSQCQR